MLGNKNRELSCYSVSNSKVKMIKVVIRFDKTMSFRELPKFTYTVNYFPSTYYAPDTLLGTEDTERNDMDTIPVLRVK